MEEWLPDTFIAQLWCNREMLQGVDFDLERSSLVGFLPQLIRSHRDTFGRPILVDGTHVVTSLVDMIPELDALIAAGNAAAADGRDVYIGMLDMAAKPNGGGVQGGAQIVDSPWPPTYVLDTVAGSNHGLVIVNNVNCGYLDFATNFLTSVRKWSDAKVRRPPESWKSLRSVFLYFRGWDSLVGYS